MEDRRFFLIVKSIIFFYNALVIAFWSVVGASVIDALIKTNSLKLGLDPEYFNVIQLDGGIMRQATESNLFTLTVVRLCVAVTIAFIGLVAVLKERHELVLLYAILESIYLVVLVIVMVFFMNRFLVAIIAIAIQTSMAILAFGLSAAIIQNKKIDDIKIIHV